MNAGSKSVSELINDVEEGRLVVRPFFQRRLIWTNKDKEFFIDTVLKGLPFPEVFVSTGEIDLKSKKLTKWLVDGQQRISTLKEYLRGSSELRYKDISRFSDLSSDDQIKFLHYQVAVRELGDQSEAQIRVMFERINSTDYALNVMEKLNAMYSGLYKKYCEALSRHPFFETHDVFPDATIKRMDDITFCLILITTMLCGYYRRAERNKEYMERYNDDFPDQSRLQAELVSVFGFIEKCGFDAKSRVWKQTDLFTLLVELRHALVVEKQTLDPKSVGHVLEEFYEKVDGLFSGKQLPDEEDIPTDQKEVFRYLKAATKASSDKYARVERATVISALLRTTIGKPVVGKAAKRPRKTAS